ncbi:MAG: DegT/DnrJ/EryC1/StrS family aminotransferase [Armatimonadota bacterium]
MAAGTHARLAIEGGTPAVTLRHAPWPIVTDWEVARMAEVVRTGAWSWLGQHETTFCRDFAQFLGCNHCLCLCNGTVTMQVALQAVGVEPGDEVIVPGITWPATLQAALDVGANAVIVDVDPETMCIDPQAVADAITPRTRALLPVQLYGCMCDMDALMVLARAHKLRVVEDVAHQHGSVWREQSAGTIGDAGSFSFQRSKTLTCGEGGAIACNDESVYQRAFALKHVGWAPGTPMTPANLYGRNFRITEMQCVLLRGGLSRLTEQIAIREENALRFAAGLEELAGPLRAARRDPRVTRQAYYALTLHFDPEKAGGLTRQQYCDALAAEGLRLGDPYDPVYASPLLNLRDRTSPVPYRDAKWAEYYAGLHLPATEKAARVTGTTLPHPHLLAEPAYIDQLLLAVRKVDDNLAGVQRHYARQAGGEEAAR